MDPRIPGELQRTRDVHLTSTGVGDDHLATTTGFFVNTSMSPGAPNSLNIQLTSSPYMPESFSYMGGQIQEPSWRRGLKRSLPESPGISPSPILGAITSNSSAAGIANTASTFTTSGVEDGSINPTGSNPSNKGKKRSRASRRAPTTVLTTDTSNFRQMVQEFTGIPASPFSAASSLSRSSLMLGSASGGVGTGLPPFLLRPFAQKPQNSTSQLLSLANNNSSNSSSNTNITTAAAASLGMNSENNLIFPLDNQYNQLQNSSINNTTLFDIQSLINSAPKFHLPNYFTQRPPPPLPQTKIGGGILDELINNNPLHISMNSQETQQATGSHLTNPMNNRPNSRLMIGGGIGNIGGGGGGGDHEEGMCLRTSGIATSTTSTNYTTSSHTGSGSSGTSCKVNTSSGSPDFHLEKGSDSLSRGDQGMVDSWICSSQD